MTGSHTTKGSHASTIKPQGSMLLSATGSSFRGTVLAKKFVR